MPAHPLERQQVPSHRPAKQAALPAPRPRRKRHAPRPQRVRPTLLLGALPDITTREELQYVLSQTIYALADDAISVYRAQTLLTLLQITL